MDFDTQVKRAISLSAQRISSFKERDEEELKAFVDSMPFNALKDADFFSRYVYEHRLSLRDVFTVLAFKKDILPFLRDVTANTKATYGEVCKAYGMAQTNFITIHRCIYIMHSAMLNVYDLVEREKRMAFKVKKYYQLTENKYADQYETPRQKNTEKAAWCTLQDYLRITDDMLRPKLDKVYESLRDYMIRLGMRDVELMGRIEVAFMLAKVVKHSYNHYFEDFHNSTGADYTKCFEYANMDVIVKRFSEMVSALGFKVVTDEHGCYELAGVNVDKCQRFKWAWHDFITMLRDEDLLDENATKAINLNEKVRIEYQQVFKEEEEKKKKKEEKKLLSGIEKLKEKYKKN